MKIKMMIMLFLLLISVVFAANPAILSVDYNQFYAGKEETFIVKINPDATNGTLNFYEGLSMVRQVAYFNTSSDFLFSANYSNPSDKNIYFRLTDINGVDENTLNNEIYVPIRVKKGIDLEVTSISISPTTIIAQNTVQIVTKVINSGDENSTAIGSLVFYYNDNNFLTTTLPIFQIGEEKSFSVSWTPPVDYNGGLIKVYANTQGQFPEFTTINNEKTLLLNNPYLAELIAADIVTKTTFRKGMVETITLIIDNNGSISVQDMQLEVYLNSVADSQRIFSNSITIGANSRKSVDFIYSFTEIKEYKFIMVLNRNLAIKETSYSNNQLQKVVSVVDYNLQAIVDEADSLRKELAIAEAKIVGIDTEKGLCQASLSTLRASEESCTSNLAICNSNNSTKIANWMKDLDANREAEKTIYLGEIARIGKEKAELIIENTAKIKAAEDEKNQWALLVIAILLGILLFIAYENLFKNKIRKAVNTSG
jgi:LEA14-like dessication related protein